MPQRSEGATQILAAQQHWLYRAITAAEAPSDCSVVKAAGKLARERRLQIYRHAYAQRLLECLRDDFPVLEAAIGAQAFEGCCRDYIVHHPPRSATLNTYGEHLPAFLGGRASLASGIPLWTSELATLEWATVRAIHADAASILSIDELSRVPLEQWGRLRLHTSDSVQLFEFRHAVDRTLRGVRDSAAVEVSVMTPAVQPSWVLVCRRGPDVWQVNLAPWAYALLCALREGSNLDDALGAASSVAYERASRTGAKRNETLAAREPEFDTAAVMRCFRDWVSWGAFASYTIEIA